MSLNRISPPAKARAHAHTYTHAPTRNLYHTHLKEAIKWVTTAWINNESKIADLVTGADPWSNFTAGVTFRLRSRNLLSGTDLNSGFHLQSNTASYLSHEYPRWSRWRSTKLSVTLTRVWVIDGRAATSRHRCCQLCVKQGGCGSSRCELQLLPQWGQRQSRWEPLPIIKTLLVRVCLI